MSISIIEFIKLISLSDKNSDLGKRLSECEDKNEFDSKTINSLKLKNNQLENVRKSFLSQVQSNEKIISSLNNDIKFLKDRYVKHDDKHHGIDANVIKKLLLREEEYKRKIYELNSDLDEVFRTDVCEINNYKILYKENPQLKQDIKDLNNHIANLKRYIREVENKIDEKAIELSDTKLLRIIDKQRDEIKQLKMSLDVYSKKSNS